MNNPLNICHYGFLNPFAFGITSITRRHSTPISLYSIVFESDIGISTETLLETELDALTCAEVEGERCEEVESERNL